jgi:hypothetical protein
MHSTELAAFAGLGLGFALGALGCGKQSEHRRQGAFELVPSQLELGSLVQNETVSKRVELRSQGLVTMRLRSHGSSTRCRWERLPDAIAPGKTTRLMVACSSDLLGPLNEELALLDATKGDTLATLQITGKVEPLVGFDTAFVDLRPEFGQTKFEDVRLVGKRATQATPSIASTGGEAVVVVPLAAEAGQTKGFRVSCKGERVGMHAGSLIVDTGIAEQPSLALSWGCRVPETLEVEPSTPYFNLRVSGERATTVTFRSRQPRFRVTAARVVEGPFHATLEQANPDGSYPITIRVKDDLIPEGARSATGKLVVQSNDEREPRKEVPLFGFGQVNRAERPDD